MHIGSSGDIPPQPLLQPMLYPAITPITVFALTGNNTYHCLRVGDEMSG